MPNRDRTGPEGKGPATGRGMGPCGKGAARGLGRGFGRGRGRGRGYNYADLSKEEEQKILKAEKKEIEQRLKELED